MGSGVEKFRHELRLMRPYAPQLIGVAAAIVLALGVWQGYRSFRDGRQVEMTCAQYAAARPASHWVKLTDCEYDFEHYAIKRQSGSIDVVYLPVRPFGETSSQSQIVVKRDDKLTLDVVEQLESNRTPSDAMVEQLRKELERPIEGLVTSALDFDADDKDKLGDLKLGLTSDYVMIDADAAPHPFLAILALVGALSLGVFAVVLFVRDRRNPPKRPPPPQAPKPRPHDPNDPIRAFERPL